MAAAEEINLQALPYNIDGYKQQLVDLPSGTLLFRANHIKSDNDGRDFFWDLLGIPTADGFCMSPVHNVFTFPFPYVGFGLNVWGNEFRAAWAKYNCIQVYVLKCSAPFINLISPSKESRGITKQRENYKNQPIRRCDTFGAACATNPTEKKAHLKYLTYDNCIVPAFREQTGCIGHIAIGANDSIDVQDATIKPHDSPMGQYLRLLSQTNAIDAATIASKLYVDVNGHRGIPEVVVTPLKPGVTAPLKQTAPTFKDAAQKVIEGTQKDIYTLELLTAITKDGYDTSLPDAGTSTPSALNTQRLSIEQHLYSFMEKGQTEGFGQAGKIMFDSRTGFYVLTGFLQDGYRLGNRGAQLDYMCDFLRPLDTPKLRQSAIEYSASIRKPVPKEAFLSESKEVRGYKKAFIFKRPGSLKKVMTELALKIPTMADGRPFTYLYKYDTVTGGVRCTMKRRSKCRKTKRRHQRGAGMFDFLAGNTAVSKTVNAQQYSIPLEQESIPAPIMDNIRDFFAQMRG